jgi:integrase/recombinase XerC
LKATDNYFQYLTNEKRYSSLTIRSYNSDLFQFISFLQNTYQIDDVLIAKHTHIRSWLAALKEEDKMSSTSINRKISCLKSFYKYQLKTNTIAALPTDKITSPKKPKRLPSFANEAQMEQLLDEVNFGSTFKDFTDRLIIDLLYATGMRRAELLGLKQTDIDMHQGQIKVIGKGSKERYLPLIPEVLEGIQHYLKLRKEMEIIEEPSLLVKENGACLYEKYIYLTVKKYLSLVSSQEKKSPHTIRHSFATHLLNRGAELNAVKELLGHASLAATQIYTHNTIDKLKNVFQQAHPKA